MGNYVEFESDFIKRTIRLIDQYNELVAKLDFDDQLNYTLTINCLLGLIVMPKERVISFIPNVQLTKEYKQDLGFMESIISPEIATFRDFIHQLRNSISHFKIEIESENADFLVDYLVFRHVDGRLVARIKSSEMVPFLNYYSESLLQNLERRRGL